MVDLVSRQLGNWKLLRLLGEGGFGQVYEAENASTELHAAVKVLTVSGPQAARAKQGFLKEARAANAAKHDAIIRVFDAGESPDGLLYMVMELLEGVTLGKALDQSTDRRLSVPDAIDLGVRISDALAAVHAKGIVHRDLKPDNVFYVPRPSDPKAIKILDFGIAKLRTTVSATLGSLQVVGTPAFMAPEQWRAAPDIDGRADIYSLGGILFLALTGQFPFSAQTIEQWMYAHLTLDPADPAKLVDLPRPLAELVLRMLRKEPSDRPGEMKAVAAQLDACRAVSAPAPAKLVEDERPPAASVRRAAFLWAALAVGVVAGFCGAWWITVAAISAS